MTGLKKIIEELATFRDERDWGKFHNPKDLALALSIEASELLELYLWKHHQDADKEKVQDELADVLIYGLMLSEKYGFDIEDIIRRKIEKNRLKYPVEKACGSAKKYNEYE